VAPFADQIPHAFFPTTLPMFKMILRSFFFFAYFNYSFFESIGLFHALVSNPVLHSARSAPVFLLLVFLREFSPPPTRLPPFFFLLSLVASTVAWGPPSQGRCADGMGALLFRLSRATRQFDLGLSS